MRVATFQVGDDEFALLEACVGIDGASRNSRGFERSDLIALDKLETANQQHAYFTNHQSD